MGVVPSNMMEDHEQSMVAAAAARPAGGLLASPIGVQSCDNIHIQMEPLHSLDAYAAKMVSPGMEVAIYSGRCPLAMLTTYQPQRAVQQQVCQAFMHVCPPSSTRPSLKYFHHVILYFSPLLLSGVNTCCPNLRGVIDLVIELKLSECLLL